MNKDILLAPQLTILFFTGFMVFILIGLFSLDFARGQTHIKLQEIAGEDYIKSNRDCFGDICEFDLYNKRGEYLGRYHTDEPYWYFFDEQGVRDNIKITKLAERGLK